MSGESPTAAVHLEGETARGASAGEATLGVDGQHADGVVAARRAIPRWARHSFQAAAAFGVRRILFLEALFQGELERAAPARATCGVRSMTRRATAVGCLMCSRHITEPQRPRSSMTQASSVT